MDLKSTLVVIEQATRIWKVYVLDAPESSDLHRQQGNVNL